MEKRTIKVSVDLEVEVPSYVNFLLTADRERLVPLRELTDKSLKMIGKVWTEELLKRAKRQRKDPGAFKGSLRSTGPQPMRPEGQ